MTVGDFGDWQRLAQTRVGQDNIVVRLEQGQLIPPARFALTQGIDPASDRRYALADVEVEPLHKCGIDGPTTWCQDLLDGQLPVFSAKYPPVHTPGKGLQSLVGAPLPGDVRGRSGH